MERTLSGSCRNDPKVRPDGPLQKDQLPPSKGQGHFSSPRIDASLTFGSRVCLAGNLPTSWVARLFQAVFTSKLPCSGQKALTASTKKERIQKDLMAGVAGRFDTRAVTLLL